MRIKAPFQGEYEHAGQGWNGRSYWLVRFVLRAYVPFHDPKGVDRKWKWPIAFFGKPEKRYY